MSRRPPPGDADPQVAALEKELLKLKGPAREKVIRALAKLLYEQTREARRLDEVRKLKP